MDFIKKTAFQIEEVMDKHSIYTKTYIPLLARFLLVVTYLEDAVRLTVQYNDQLDFLANYRGLGHFLASLFIIVNIIAMTVFSACAIFKKHTEISTGVLASITIIQAFVYGMIYDASFMMRNLSLLGGLFLLIVEAQTSARKGAFAGLPEINKLSSSSYLALAGRVMLVLLFFSLTFSGSEFGVLGLVFSIISLIVCIMVVVGFQAKYSAMLLLAALSIFNVMANNFWSLHIDHASRDYMQYDFFQSLSVVGGLLLLVSVGPGELSVDQNKKDY